MGVLRKLYFCCYALLAFAILFILLFFNQPLLKVVNYARANLIVSHLSRINTGHFEQERSIDRLQQEFIQLEKQASCLTGSDIKGHRNLKTPRSVGIAKIIGDTDLRDYFWSIKVRNSIPNVCLFDEALKHKPYLSPEDYSALITQQWNQWNELFQHDYFLEEIDLQNQSEDNDSYRLSLGLVNGSSLILLDGRPVAYFRERSESDQLVNLKLETGKIHRLSLLNYSEGNAAPGIAHVEFIGLLTPDSTRSDLFPKAATREATTLFTIYAMFFLSLLLIVFSTSLKEKSQWPVLLAILLLDFALSQALDLDHVQATLDGEYIRGLRYFFTAVFIFASAALNFDLLRAVVPALRIGPKYFPNLKLNISQITTALKISLVLIYSCFLGISLIGVLPALFSNSPFRKNFQFQILDPFLNFGTAAGILVIGAGFLVLALRSRIKEDEEAVQLSELFTLLMASGLGYLIYTSSYRSFFSEWLFKENVPTAGMFLQSQVLPIIVAAGILILVARVLSEQKAFRKVVPESIQQVIKQRSRDESELNRTSTEYNWIIINDFHESTELKATNLAIITHIHQSNFHKLHKDYFKGAIHFYSSQGDAMLLAIKSPLENHKGDPLLEKFVRAYCLHQDGVKMLKSSFDVTLAIMKLENRELYRAIERQNQKNEEQNLLLKEFRFRTILNSDYYFYGLNHEISNIDSKTIYLISKAEKAIVAAENGGFIVFPELMQILQYPLSRIPSFLSYFEECPIDKDRVREHIAQFLPNFVYVLKPERSQEFDRELTKLYGRPLPLRISADNDVSYFSVEPQVEAFCSALTSSTQSLDELIRKVKHSTPRLRNFAEKNRLIESIAELAVRMDVWSEPPKEEEILRLIQQIGMPQSDLFESIRERDEKYEPQQVLSDLRSNEPTRRNWGMRILRLARIQNELREESLPGADFVKEVSQIYLRKFHVFGVESHIYFWQYLLSRPDFLNAFFDQVKSSSKESAHFADLLAYLQSSEPESLKGLHDKILHLVPPGRNA